MAMRNIQTVPPIDREVELATTLFAYELMDGPTRRDNPLSYEAQMYQKYRDEIVKSATPSGGISCVEDKWREAAQKRFDEMIVTYVIR